MSESGAEPSGTDTEQEGQTGTEPGTGEESGAAELLGGMLDNDPEKLAEELEKWKGLARKHEKRAGQNADAAAKLREIEQANMSELERSKAEAAEAIRERDEARADHSRVMAAAAHNLPVEMLMTQVASTDEISERANARCELIETRARRRRIEW